MNRRARSREGSRAHNLGARSASSGATQLLPHPKIQTARAREGHGGEVRGGLNEPMAQEPLARDPGEGKREWRAWGVGSYVQMKAKVENVITSGYSRFCGGDGEAGLASELEGNLLDSGGLCEMEDDVAAEEGGVDVDAGSS